MRSVVVVDDLQSFDGWIGGQGEELGYYHSAPAGIVENIESVGWRWLSRNA